ncbi:RNA polymerase sigma factor [Steroidobacter cummioxidans]|uniref:RNA polymerase sigma factor n=1 Tax=Steroidobacter cummioxidans TaxID=1803913 RepID=UPI000E31D623|nr:RNA polymerase sigma factor [Steroidobacter cummioxidans]
MTTDIASSVPTDEDDISIARRVAGGDQVAFAGLMRRYNRRLYRLARAVLKDPTEADDVLQEVYLSAYQSLPQFRGDAALSTWLSRLVLNECSGRLRRNHRRQNVIPMVSSTNRPEVDSVAARESELPDKAIGRAQIRDILEHKLDELPEPFRLVFVLRSVEELSVQDTALTLDIPEDTVRSRHFRARSLLREALAQEIDLAERDVFEFGGGRCDGVIARVLARLSEQS